MICFNKTNFVRKSYKIGEKSRIKEVLKLLLTVYQIILQFYNKLYVTIIRFVILHNGNSLWITAPCCFAYDQITPGNEPWLNKLSKPLKTLFSPMVNESQITKMKIKN